MSQELLNNIAKKRALLEKLEPTDYRYSYTKQLLEELEQRLKSLTASDSIKLHKETGPVCEGCQ